MKTIQQNLRGCCGGERGAVTSQAILSDSKRCALDMSMDPQSVGTTQYIITCFCSEHSEEELVPITGWLSSRTLAALRGSGENQLET